MKKIMLILFTTLMIVSCKKYDKCCHFTAYDKMNTKTIKSDACTTDMSKKELDKFNTSNGALENYNNTKKDPFRYVNPTYTCD